MKISKFHKLCTDGSNYYLKDVLHEVGEFFIEVIKFNRRGIVDEFGDISANFQLWLYTRFKIDSRLWKPSMLAYDKLHKRKKIWNRIYKHVGLKRTTNYFGNYERLDKVIGHLKKFGISEKKAKEAYEKIVKGYSSKAF